MAFIICECGSWLKAPRPGEGCQLRCPSCGRVVGPDGRPVDASTEVGAEGGLFRWLKGPAVRYPRRGRQVGIGEALAYPLSDGAGLMLLTFFPPLLTIMSVPVFDLLLLIRSGPRGSFNPLALLLLPFAMPLIISFIMTGGYLLLYLGMVLAESALGRDDHPRFPLWDRQTIFEGMARWLWAALVGLGIGGLPLLAYGRLRGWEFGALDWAVAAVLVALAAGYTQMGLAAAILHDNIAQAHPITVGRAIGRIGREYLLPWLATAMALLLALGAWRLVMYHAPNLTAAALGLWGFWVLVLYEAMAVMHILGRTCHRNAIGLGWFRRAPRWCNWERPGRIYSNS